MNNVKTSTEKIKQYFYNRFKNTDYKTTLLELKNVNERERIINELAENQDEAYYYNNIYEKVLKNISIIFKNNDDFIKSKSQLQTTENIQNQKKFLLTNITKITLKLIGLLFFPCSIFLFLIYIIWVPAFYIVLIFILAIYIYTVMKIIKKHSTT